MKNGLYLTDCFFHSFRFIYYVFATNPCFHKTALFSVCLAEYIYRIIMSVSAIDRSILQVFCVSFFRE